MARFDNKVVLVSGGARGQGAAGAEPRPDSRPRSRVAAIHLLHGSCLAAARFVPDSPLEDTVYCEPVSGARSRRRSADQASTGGRGQ
jgi:hypothetical protein